MAHPPCLLVLLFLIFHVSNISSLPLSTYDDSMCSESFSCGVVDIKYPFYLSNKIQATPDYKSNYSCGYTDLKISCQGEGKAKTPILELDEESYTILNIFYNNHTIILADTDVLGDNNGCPRVSHNVSFSQEWMNYTNSFDSLAFFFNCYSKPDDTMPSEFPAEKYQINCNPPAVSGVGVSFVFTSDSEERNVSQEYDLADHCGKIFVVPVDEDALPRSNPLVLPSQYGAVLKKGFELVWNLSTALPWCHQCENSYGRCAYSENKEFIGCLCSGGKVGVSDCYGSSNTTASTNSASSKSFRTDPAIMFPSETNDP